MVDFIKRRLSPKALDEFVLRFVDPNAKSFVLYTTNNNEQVKFSPYLCAIGNGAEQFYYLIGQTMAYHKDNSRRDTCPVEELIFIMNENNKPVPWTNNPRDFSQLIELAHRTAALMAINKPNGQMEVTINRLIEPVIHRESAPHDTK